MATKKRPPKPTLPASVFERATTVPATKVRHYPLQVIDSHVHVWEDKQMAQIQWIKKPVHNEVLNSALSLSFLENVTKSFRAGESKEGKRWKAAADQASFYAGVVYLQVDSDFDDSDSDGRTGGWDASIKEIDVLCEASLVTPSLPLLGIVPWVPLLHGPEAVQSYISKLLQLPSLLSVTLQNTTITSATPTQGTTPSPIRGFRYLLDYPEASEKMLDDKVITALQLLGSKGYIFEIMVNVQLQGISILDQVAELVKRTNENQPENERTKFIIDHFARPDLKATPSSNSTHPLSSANPLSGYLNSLFELSLQSTVYLKLSGLLNEFDPTVVKAAFKEFSDRNADGSLTRAASVSNLVTPNSAVPEAAEIDAKTATDEYYSEVKKILKLVIEPALESFGESRIIFGTDWPRYRPLLFVGPTDDPYVEQLAYEFEAALYRETLVEIGLAGEAIDKIFFLNAKEFYGI